MLFPQVSVEEWIERHPGLEIEKERCPSCRKEIVKDIPYMSKDWVGLHSGECSCGHDGSIIALPRNSKSQNILSSIFSSFSLTDEDHN